MKSRFLFFLMLLAHIGYSQTNTPPVASSQTVSVIEQIPTTIVLSGSDSENDPLTYIILSNPSNGTVTLDGATATYTSNSDTATGDIFTFKVSDGTIDSDPATVTINITTVNDAPVSYSQTIDAIEQVGKSITLSATDPDNATLYYNIVDGPSYGSITLNSVTASPNGNTSPTLTYISNSETATSDSFTWKASDLSLESNTSTVTLNITLVNDKPVAIAQTIEAIEQTAKTITLFGTDAEGNTLTYSIVSNPSNGTVTLDGATATYTSNSDTATSDSFTFKVNDGTIDSDPATVTVNITNVVPDVNAISIDKSTVEESGKVTISATISEADLSDITIPITYSGTATMEQDYSTLSNTVSDREASTVAGTGFQDLSLTPAALARPTDLAFDSDDNMYVLNSASHSVKKFTVGSNQGEVYIGGQLGACNACLHDPDGMFIDIDKNIYVSDTGNHRIIKFEPGNSEGVVVAGGNGFGNDHNQLNEPRGVFVKANGDIYVADYNNGRIQLWKSGSDTGETVFDNSKIPVSLPKKQFPAGTNLDQPLKLTDIYVNLNNEIYVLDHSFGYVWKLNSNDNVAEILIDNLYADNDFNKGTQGFFVRDDGSIFITIADTDGENKIVKWSPYFGDKKARLLIGSSKGDGSKKFNRPYDISFDSNGDLYVADKWNHRIQKLKLSKSLLIPAGQTSASLDINILEDNTDEDDEAVILTPGAVIGANNSNTDVFSFTISDDDDPPTITFTKNSESIVENSSADITIDVVPSVPSGKDIEIPYTLSGTAESSEYTVSESPLKISAGSLNGKISISTNGKDDNDVEPRETIILTYGSIVNASTTNTETSVTLLSDDKPTLTLSSNKEEFYEHEEALITATINTEHSYDVNVSFGLSGNAIFSEDYSIDFENKGEITTVAGGNGNGFNSNQLNYPSDLHVDSNQNVYVISGRGGVSKWAKGASEAEIVVELGYSPGEYSSIFVDSFENIYIAETSRHIVSKWEKGSNQGVVVAGTEDVQGSSLDKLNDPSGVFVDSSGNVYVGDSKNFRVVKWAPGATEGVVVAGGNGKGNSLNQLSFNYKVNVHSSGDIYAADEANNRIVKWVPGATEGVIVAGGESNNGGFGKGQIDDLSRVRMPRGIYVDENRDIYVADRLNNRVVLWKEGDTKGRLISNGSNNSVFNNPTGIFVDIFKNIYIVDQDNSRVEKINYYPELKINAGELTTTFEIQGIEELNYIDEGNEEIIITPIADNSNISGNKTVIIKDNVVEFVKKDEPFIKLSKSSISWGDYDRDGDMDLAIMGQSNSVGAVTAIYENKEGTFEDTNQNFTNVYDGDLSWVDLNKDGWLDLVVTGYNQIAKTNIYINNNGETFETSSADWGIPNAYASKMSWGDLDNDGDIDLALSGVDDQENPFSYLYLRVDAQDNFIVQDLSYFSGGGLRNGDLEIADFDQDSDNDLIFVGEREVGGAVEIRQQIKLNSFISPDDPKYDNLPLKYSRDIEENIPLGFNNASITTYFNQENKELSYIIMGRETNGDLVTLVRSVGDLDRQSDAPSLALEKGDIAVGDINNDGFNDFMFTGEDENGSPVTKLFYTKSNTQGSPKTIVESDFNFVGLRESNVEFVDYDTDGDLDIFISGLSDSGAETVLYQVNFPQKVNTAPSEVQNLSVTDLGYGNIKFDWDESTDDFSNAIGYNIKIGTSPGGSELSNTLSDLETGSRLISSPPPILVNQYKTNLFPGVYYISAQAIDPGVKASNFSDETKLTLLYEWKLLNQGGIVDRYISGKEKPILKLANLDGDDDLDLLFGSEIYYSDSNGNLSSTNRLTSHKYDSEEKRMIRYDREAKTQNSLSNLNINSVTDVQVALINDDEFPDVVINRYTTVSEFGEPQIDLLIHFGKAPVGGGSSNLNEETLIYDQIRIGDGLYEGKLKLADLNNDGGLEILQVGLTTDNPTSGVPKLLIYSYDNDSNTFTQSDISQQIAALSDSSFDLGDVDNDQDIDFVITGFDQSNGLKSYLYKNTSDTGGEFKLEVTENNFAAIRDGSIDFFDYDTDGDLDILITGTGVSGDIFEIYVNKLNENITNWPRLNTIDIPGLREGKIDFGDFNGDGYSDLLYSGIQSGLGKVSELREYDPTSNKFIKSSFDIGEIIDADVEFGDIDGDGDLDFVLAGTNKNNDNYHTISTFLNVRSESSEFTSSFKPVDDNGIKVRKSVTLNSQNQTNNYVKNNPPSAPSVTGAVILSDQQSIQGKTPIELQWNSSSDDLTQSTGLSYSIRVGTTPGGSEIMSPNANDIGLRTIPSKGNAEHNLKWKLALTPGTYYWSVQAVDASFIGSEFSTEQTIVVDDDKILLDSDSDGVYDDADQCPDTPSGVKVDVTGCQIFELPLNNYSVEVGSATCIGNTDGVINLSVEDASYDYSVTVSGQSNLSITGTSTTASSTGLAPGTYEVCFKVVGQDGYEQCFEVVVGEPEPLSAFIDVDDNRGKMSVTMRGSSKYYVNVNGLSTTVDGNTFETELSTGLSIITISTDLDCQGVIEREVFISEEIHYYPNPTISNVKVHVGGEDEAVKVSVFSEKGDLIYTRDQKIEEGSRKIQVNLTNQITGTYIVTLESKTVRQSFKVIRE